MNVEKGLILLMLSRLKLSANFSLELILFISDPKIKL